MTERSLLRGEATMRPATGDEWPVLAWLWQLFRYDLARVTNAWPYADGRYQAAVLAAGPSPDLAAYLVWRPHPKTGEEAPVAFALVGGLQTECRTIHGFWVVPPLRRVGLGRELALAVLAEHPSPWLIGFQHDNAPAGRFWRVVAAEAFGIDRWTESRKGVPGLPEVPPDHLITSV